MNRWKPKSDLEAALTALKLFKPFEPALDLVGEVALAENELGFSLPSELRTFYQSIRPSAFLGAEESVRIYPVDSVDFWQHEQVSDFEISYPEWANAQFLVFGATVFGDELLYSISDAKAARRGAIVVTDHERDYPLVVLGENLADWLARLAAFSGRELAVVPGETKDLGNEVVLAFAEDHLRLNPDSEWAARIVYAAHTPRQETLIYWDRRERRLRPIEEMTWLEHVEILNVETANLKSLASLKELKHLTLSSCSAADLSPLASAQKLEWLGIYDGPDTSVAPLAALSHLNQLRTMRTQLHDVAALAAIPALDFLEITNSAFDDVVSVAKITSLTQLSLAGTQIKTLAPLVALQGLTYLGVNGTRVTDLTPALELPRLKTLIVPKGVFSSKALADLRRRRPSVELTVW